MTSISSPKATDDPFGLPLITCARYHVRTTALETEALALSAREFGTVCRAAYEHWTSATNILRCCWRHICFDKTTALCDILYKCLRNILTHLIYSYSLNYYYYYCHHHRHPYLLCICFQSYAGCDADISSIVSNWLNIANILSLSCSAIYLVFSGLNTVKSISVA